MGTLQKVVDLLNVNGASIDANFGPWASTSAYLSWLYEQTGLSAPKDGTTIAVKGSDGTITKHVWEKGAFREDGSSGYVAPDGGIPKSDLASGVRASLDKADSALQTHQDISGKLDASLAANVYATKSEMDGEVEDLEDAINDLTGLEGSNFAGIYTTLDLAKDAYSGSVGWALVGSSITALEAYRIDSASSATKIGDSYDFTDFSGLGDKVADLERIVYNSGLDGSKDTTLGSFAVSDERGNCVVVFKDGDVQTKNFDSSKNASASERGLMSKADKVKLDSMSAGADKSGSCTDDTSGNGLDISDESGNVVVRFKNGNVQTKNFDSSVTPKQGSSSDGSDFSIQDENGKSVVEFKDGHVMTKNFNSKTIAKVVTLSDGRKMLSF